MSFLCVFVVVTFFAVVSINARSTNPPDTFKQNIADLRDPSGTALQEKIIKLALEISPPPGIAEDGESFMVHEFQDAAQAGDVDKMKTLLKDNPELVNVGDEYGLTLLQWVAPGRHKDVAELLLARGADVNAKGNNGSTALHSVARCCCCEPEMAELLLGKGADVNARDREGKTPLGRALAEGINYMADLLRQHGVKE
jgi:ankyrin repeat protein